MSETLKELLELQAQKERELVALRQKVEMRRQADEKAQERLMGRLLKARFADGFDDRLNEGIFREWLGEALTKNQDRVVFDLPLLPDKKRGRPRKSKSKTKSTSKSQSNSPVAINSQAENASPAAVNSETAVNSQAENASPAAVNSEAQAPEKARVAHKLPERPVETENEDFYETDWGAKA